MLKFALHVWTALSRKTSRNQTYWTYYCSDFHLGPYPIHQWTCCFNRTFRLGGGAITRLDFQDDRHDWHLIIRLQILPKTPVKTSCPFRLLRFGGVSFDNKNWAPLVVWVCSDSNQPKSDQLVASTASPPP